MSWAAGRDTGYWDTQGLLTADEERKQWLKYLNSDDPALALKAFRPRLTVAFLLKLLNHTEIVVRFQAMSNSTA